MCTAFVSRQSVFHARKGTLRFHSVNEERRMSNLLSTSDVTYFRFAPFLEYKPINEDEQAEVER